MQRSPTSRRYFQFSCLTSEKGNGQKSTERKEKEQRRRREEKVKLTTIRTEYTACEYTKTIILIFTGKIHKGTNGTYTTKQATLVFSLIFAAVYNDTRIQMITGPLHDYINNSQVHSEFHFVSVRTKFLADRNFFANHKSGNFDSRRFTPSLSSAD